MGFPITDFRFTTRRSATGTPTIYPMLMRDASMLPKLALAIRHVEGMVGQERAACDSDVLMQFFGDPKLARCLIACLGRTYRFIPRTPAEVLHASALAYLSTLGIQTSKHLRLWLYDRLNGEHHGFLPSHGRIDLSAAFEQELRLRPGEFERLLYLDDEDHAVLTRFGAVPSPEDIVAQHNARALETLLRHTQHLVVSLARTTPQARAAILHVCATEQVIARIDGDDDARLHLFGRQDAMENWSRWGRRLARTVFKISERVRPVMRDIQADVVIRDRALLWKPGAEALDMLAGAAVPSAGWEDDDGWDATTVQSATLIPGNSRPGWGIRRWPEVQAWKQGPVVPDLTLVSREQRIHVCAVRSTRHAERLAALTALASSGDGLLFVGRAASLLTLHDAGKSTLSMERFDLKPVLDALETVVPRPDTTRPSPEAA